MINLILSETMPDVPMVSQFVWKKELPEDYIKYDHIGVVGADLWKQVCSKLGFCDNFKDVAGTVYKEKFVCIRKITNQANSEAKHQADYRLLDCLGKTQDVTYEVLTTAEQMDDLIEKVKKAEVIALDTETTGLDPYVNGSKTISVGLYFNGVGYTIPYNHPECNPAMPITKVHELYKVLRDEFKGTLVGHNAKFDKTWLAVVEGYDLHFDFDTMIASALLDENKSSHGLKQLAVNELNGIAYEISTEGKKGGGDLQSHCRYLAFDIFYTYLLWDKYSRELDAAPFEKFIFENISMPAVEMYSRCFYDGVYLNPKTFNESAKTVLNKIDEYRAKTEAWAPGVNWGSPKQLRELFHSRGIHSPKVTDKGMAWLLEVLIDVAERSEKEASKVVKGLRNSYQGAVKCLQEGDITPSVLKALGIQCWIDDFESFAFDALQELSADYPICADVIELRMWEKYLSTFIGPWSEKMKDWLLRPNFRITGTVTGRPSCSDPNLQQIPRDTTIRSIVDAPEGWDCVEADLSQAELRIAAIMSGDQELRRSYREGEDIHAKTVNHIFHIPLDQMTKEQRKKGKAINFGFLYGMYPKKFQEYAWVSYQTKFTLAECENTRDSFMELYHSLPVWHEEQKAIVKKHGEIWSPIGRTRHLPKAWSQDRLARAEAERQAINSPVQGFAADIVLSATCQLAKEYGPDVMKIWGTIHDATGLRTRHDKTEEIANRLKYLMEHPPVVEQFLKQFPLEKLPKYFQRFYENGQLCVPLKAEVEIGSWGKPTRSI